jgi:hypothetical protein
MKGQTPSEAKGSSRRKHASGVSIPEKIMDRFVVMRFAEMLAKGEWGRICIMKFLD